VTRSLGISRGHASMCTSPARLQHTICGLACSALQEPLRASCPSLGQSVDVRALFDGRRPTARIDLRQRQPALRDRGTPCRCVVKLDCRLALRVMSLAPDLGLQLAQPARL